MRIVKWFIRHESGETAVEYAAVVAFVGALIVATLNLVGINLMGKVAAAGGLLFVPITP